MYDTREVEKENVLQRKVQKSNNFEHFLNSTVCLFASSYYRFVKILITFHSQKRFILNTKITQSVFWDPFMS